MIAVRSSVIRAIDYDVDTRILFILFNSGLLYKYRSVPERIFNGLLNARSKGTYYNSYVKGRFSEV